MMKAVAIDFDDTLCLTEAACFAMENDILKTMGRPPMSRDLHVQTWGKPLFEAIATRSPGIDVAAFRKAFQPIIADYIRSGKLDAISEANYAALDRLLEMGLTLLILTSRTHEELKHLLEPDHLLASRVKTFYYRDVMQYHKPDPRAFNELLGENALQPNECVYIGDSISDAEAAKSAGLHFIASLESGLRTKDDFAHLPVDAFIQSFPEILDALKKLGAS